MPNKPWSRDELILALDRYFAIQPAAPGPGVVEIKELSRFLNDISKDEGTSIPANFRSVASVVMKLMNFRSLDPSYPGAGLRAVGRTDREVWNEFADDRSRLSATAVAIRAAYSHAAGRAEALPESEILEASEGAILTRLHLQRERARRLVERKKASVLAAVGRLECEACGFNFEEVYGSRGRGFIECHHVKPLHTLRPGDKTHIDELALVCANCHRMIHARRPWPSLDQLREILKGATHPVR